MLQDDSWAQLIGKCEEAIKLRAPGARWKISMSQKQMTDECMEKWCEWYADNHLKWVDTAHRIGFGVVDFSKNQLTEKGVEQLLEVLVKTDSFVASLKLHSNSIGCADGKSFRHLLQKGELRELHVTDNRLDDKPIVDIISTVVSAEQGGQPCYPIGGKIPFWLQASRNLYNSKVLQDRLRKSLQAMGRELETSVCAPLVRAAEEGVCAAHKCGRITPTPPVHAISLFEDCKRWPEIAEDGHGLPANLHRSGHGLKDDDVPAWCDMFKRCCQGPTHVEIKEIDFAGNQLSASGAQRLLEFLMQQQASVRYLRNWGGQGEDIDLLSIHLKSRRGSQRCPAKSAGCSCGKGCEYSVTKEYVETVWVVRSERSKIQMSDEGIDDELMAHWCLWFERHVRKTACGVSWREYKEVDFSNNYITAHGLQLLLNVLMKVRVYAKVLKVHHNKIELEQGGTILQFLEWSGGALQQLHMSHNALNTKAVYDIIRKIASLKDHNHFMYPLQNQTPFYLRVEKNSYDSNALEMQLETAFEQIKRPLKKTLCQMSHSSQCQPWYCNRLDSAPAIHAMYLFTHHDFSFEGTQLMHSPFRLAPQTLKQALDALNRSQPGSQEQCLHVQHCEGQLKDNVSMHANRSPWRSKCRGFCRLAMTSLVLVPSAQPCFITRTLFHRPDGGKVRAAELADGDELVGPDGSTVKVLRVSKIPRQLRDIVHVRVEHAACAFSITSDHRIQVKVADESIQVKTFGEIVEMLDNGHSALISDGTFWYPVTQATVERDEVEVVMVHFQADALVLAGIHARKVSGDVPQIAIFGEPPNQEDMFQTHGLRSHNTFLDETPASRPMQQSRSADALGNPDSNFSSGSIKHRTGDCTPCRYHQRFLHDRDIEAPNPKPCRAGASCSFCHEPHHLRRKYRRPPKGDRR